LGALNKNPAGGLILSAGGGKKHQKRGPIGGRPTQIPAGGKYICGGGGLKEPPQNYWRGPSEGGGPWTRRRALIKKKKKK